MEIGNNILRHYLRNCYFINGTAYAGKSTMCRMLAERYGMIHCGENYNLDTIHQIADLQLQPNVSYMKTMPSWEHFVMRTPDEYEAWVDGNARELPQFEVAELIRLSADRKVIVDTNIPCRLLWEISDYDHVAIMLSPQAMSVERFFDRSDPEKQFLLSVIDQCPDPAAALSNFRNCIARINSPQRYEEYLSSGFFTLVREDDGRDTREEMLSALAAHFGLEA
ncbi:MAG: hypothetical protein J6K32_01050 [Clostridia bacterium]|nr:hypothetical protein [Clostridia bacterium]